MTHIQLSQQDENGGEGTEEGHAWSHSLPVKPSEPDSDWK